MAKGESYTKGDRVWFRESNGEGYGIVTRGGKRPIIAIDSTFTSEGDRFGWSTIQYPAAAPHIKLSDEPLPDECEPPEEDPFYSKGFDGVKFDRKPQMGHDSMVFVGNVLRHGEETGIIVEDTGMGGGCYTRFSDVSEEDREAFEAACEEYEDYKGYDLDLWVDIWVREVEGNIPRNRPFSLLDVTPREEFEADLGEFQLQV